MPGGRPTKYTPELVKKAKAYIDQYKEHGDVIPSIAGLAVVLEVARETVRAWGHEEDKAEFSAILAKLLATQENLLLNKGLSSEFNSNIAKLVLGKHGYHEKVDNTHSGPGGGAIKTLAVNGVSPEKG